MVGPPLLLIPNTDKTEKASTRRDFSTSHKRRLWTRIFYACLAVCLCCPSSGTQADSRPEIGVRALGLSGAFISNADGSTGALWNPAGLANLQNGSLVYDLSQGALSFALPLSRYGTMGISLVDLNGTDRFFIDKPNNPIGTFEFGNNQAVLSYAASIRRWQIGGNVGYNRAPYEGSLWIPSYDLGIVGRLNPHWSVGASIRDIAGVEITDDDGKPLQSFDQQFAIGGTWTPFRQLRLNSAFNVANRAMAMGAEVGTHDIAFRFGSVIDFLASEPTPHWSLGLTIGRWSKQLNYAYLTRPNPNSKHIVSVGWTFGGNTHRNKQPAYRPSWTRPASSNQNKRMSNASIRQLAAHYNVEVELTLAVIRVESNFNPNAVSSSGAVGLMQLMPGTARDLGLKVPNYRNALKPTHDDRIDERFNPRKNMRAGIAYLATQLRRYDDSYVHALAAYFVGPAKVRETGSIPRRADRYAAKVLKHYYEYKSNSARTNAAIGRLENLLASRR
ncbi:MAG: transglycosylase SLT domain-containing protein [Candidatus Poribacteria bacterium]|nr:transglycosylase SLT domain-containing protein [Candidatus Poribacteria bacterium]MDE0503232.1 transglycosylase SLT domain-containing protein [Candidatus Poribacteria bacterium]